MKPKILVLDIETSPAKAYIWRMYDENIGLDQLIEPGRIIMVGAKWVGERGGYQYDEQADGPVKMLRATHALLSEADAVVTYNGDKFDLAWLNGEFVRYRLPPLPPVTSIDLLKTIRRFRLQSNKLAFVGPFLEVGKKIDAGGFKLWADCLAGNKRAWAKMRTYNKGDVTLTEAAYLRLRPYIANHPHLGEPAKKGRDDYQCGRCGKVTRKYHHRGYYRTLTTRTPRIQCQECGGWGRGKRERIR